MNIFILQTVQFLNMKIIIMSEYEKKPKLRIYNFIEVKELYF